MEIVTSLICAFFGTLGFTILFNVHRRFYVCCGLTGMAGWAAYLAAAEFTTAPMASFAGALVVVLLSRSFAVWKRCPITVFLVAGIFPLIPGSSVYYTAYYLVTNSLELAAQSGIQSIKIAFAIVVGIVFVLSLPKEFFDFNRFKKSSLHLK